MYLLVVSAKTTATIGKTVISKDDLRRKIAIESCYDNAITNDMAFAGIADMAIEKEVLAKAFTRTIADKEIAAYVEWMDKNTRAPAILDCVKKCLATILMITTTSILNRIW